jgi:hypothetical protein
LPFYLFVCLPLSLLPAFVVCYFCCGAFQDHKDKDGQEDKQETTGHLAIQPGELLLEFGHLLLLHNKGAGRSIQP